MDRTSFINLASEYHMLAISIYCQYLEQYYSEEGLLDNFTILDDE